MAVTSVSFKIAFPEFSEVSDTLVDAKIGESQRELDSGAFGDIYDDAVSYLTAHKLAISPYGQQLQLVSDDGRTTYGDHYYGHLRYLSKRRGQISGGGLT